MSMPTITLETQIPDLSGKLSGGQVGGPGAAAKSFGDVLKDSIAEVDTLQKTADEAVKQMAAGGEKDVHQTMIAMEKASISFQLMIQVRNKIVSAYQEVMRVQV